MSKHSRSKTVWRMVLAVVSVLVIVRHGFMPIRR